nr:CcdB family protein [Sphingomonas asaccharolytica]
MAQFDVFRPRDGEELLLDCQCNFLDRLQTRFVVPLLSPGDMPIRIAKLNPRFEIDGREFFMATQGAATIPARMIGTRVASLAEDHHVIVGALDMLISGF